MSKIKLKEWADKHGLSYITANRHFHAGLIPNAQQLDSGTILVEDESLEQNMAANASTNDAMSLFLKKTVEFSKNNSSVEDFAAYVISNFQLKLNGTADGPKYSKNRPKPEEVQKHFQQFLPDKEKAEQLKAVKNALKEQSKGDPRYENPDSNVVNPLEQVLEEPNPFVRLVDTTSGMDAEYEDIGNFLSSYAEENTEGLVTRSVDLNTTPQQINYTGSTNQTFSNSLAGNLPVVSNSIMVPASGSLYFSAPVAAAFQPTKKELLSASQVIETAESDGLPRKRGRKPTLIKKR